MSFRREVAARFRSRKDRRFTLPWQLGRHAVAHPADVRPEAPGVRRCRRLQLARDDHLAEPFRSPRRPRNPDSRAGHDTSQGRRRAPRRLRQPHWHARTRHRCATARDRTAARSRGHAISGAAGARHAGRGGVWGLRRVRRHAVGRAARDAVGGSQKLPEPGADPVRLSPATMGVVQRAEGDPALQRHRTVLR